MSLVFEGCTCDFNPAVVLVLGGADEVLVVWIVGDVADFGRGRSANFIGRMLLAVGDDLDMSAADVAPGLGEVAAGGGCLDVVDDDVPVLP